MTIDFVEKMGLVTKRHGKRPDDIAHTCHECDVCLIL